MTKARTNASASPAVGRNMIINGAMNVAQRATSVTGIGANAGVYATVDRFRHFSLGESAGRFTSSQTSDGPDGISANCLKLDCTTADTSIGAAERLDNFQILEGQNVQRIGKGLAGAKQITVSFYVKASASFTFGCEIYDLDNERQMTQLFNTTTDWNRIELTYPADVDGGDQPFDDDNAGSIQLGFWLHAGSNYTSGTLETAFANATTANRAAGIDSFFSSTDNNFFITGVQMEVGPVATEFEQEDISTTLAKCQRYYYKLNSIGNNAYHYFGTGQNRSTTVTNTVVNAPVTMRTSPTMGTTGTAANYGVLHNGNTITACSSIPAIAGDTDGVLVHNITAAVSSGLTAGDAVFLLANNVASAYLDFDAEL